MAAPLSHTLYTLPFPCSFSRTLTKPFVQLWHRPFSLKKQYQNTNNYFALIKHTTTRSSHSFQDQTSDGEDSLNESKDDKFLSLMQVYKEAILVGDVKAVYEIEAVISAVVKERDDLAQKVSSLSAEVDSGKEKYIRLQADFDNFRKRYENERLTTRTNAQGEVIESLLPLIDNFERAKRQIKLETDKEKKIDASYQGIYKQFVEIMRSLRVAAVPTVGKPFDPSLHEAIAREESQEFNDGIIIEEFRRGFLLGDRLLRPATVKVSSGPGRRIPSSVAQKSTGHPAATSQS